MVDVGPTHATQLVAGLADAGWKVGHEHADGADALSAALQRRGWDAVLYGGDRRGAVPARKALALVRLADPHLPFLAVSPYVRRGELSSVIRGLGGAVAHVSNSAELARALAGELDAARMRRRVGGAHRFLLAQQAISDHLAAGLEPDELCARVLATLGETLGWSLGIVWHAGRERPSCAARAPGTRPTPGPRCSRSRRGRAQQHFAPGQGPARPRVGVPAPVLGRRTSRATRAFRAPAGAARRAADRRGLPPRRRRRLRGRDRVLLPRRARAKRDISAMFATVGGQLAHYLRPAAPRGAESLRTGSSTAPAAPRRRGRADRGARRRRPRAARQRRACAALELDGGRDAGARLARGRRRARRRRLARVRARRRGRRAAGGRRGARRRGGVAAAS